MENDIQTIKNNLKTLIKSLTLYLKYTKIKLEIDYNAHVDSMRIKEVQKKDV